MPKSFRYFLLLIIAALLAAPAALSAAAPETGWNPPLPAPYATKPVTHPPKVIGWPDGAAPQAPKGFVVTRFIDHLQNPRWLYVLPNGDVLVSEATEGRDSPNRILLLRGLDQGGAAKTRSTFLSGLNRPFGMALLKGNFYVGTTDAVWRFPYHDGETSITEKGEKILDLPAGGYNYHWTRNLLASPDGTKLYVTVGSGSNVGEHGMEREARRADILEIDPDGKHERILASGLRNPVGLGWEPETGKLWTSVNERDNLGDDLVPDFMTSVKDGGFYGWPFYYYGKNQDPRWQGRDPQLSARVLIPDYALGSHTACLGLAFYTARAFPADYRGGVFIGQHGSWNRSVYAGYKVVFIPFAGGKPSGAPQDFLTGFMKDPATGEAFGRPVGVAVAKDGALLVADDAGKAIWRVGAGK